MGTWAFPYTDKKANALAERLNKPIKRKRYHIALSGLIGDDDLFDNIDKFELEHEDIRIPIYYFLHDMLTNIHLTLCFWQKGAIDTCIQIVNDFADNGFVDKIDPNDVYEGINKIEFLRYKLVNHFNELDLTVNQANVLARIIQTPNSTEEFICHAERITKTTFKQVIKYLSKRYTISTSTADGKTTYTYSFL